MPPESIVGDAAQVSFPAVRADKVQAASQRWLLNLWKKELGRYRIPRWQSVGSENLSRVADNISFLDVVGTDGQSRFQIRVHGRMVGRVFGLADCSGKFLYDSVAEPRRSELLAPYRYAISSGRPVYTVQDITDREGRLVHYERLLLPFSRDGETADRVLASFEFVCPDGAFQSDNLMATQGAPPVTRLSAAIEVSAGS